MSGTARGRKLQINIIPKKYSCPQLPALNESKIQTLKKIDKKTKHQASHDYVEDKKRYFSLLCCHD